MIDDTVMAWALSNLYAACGKTNTGILRTSAAIVSPAPQLKLGGEQEPAPRQEALLESQGTGEILSGEIEGWARQRKVCRSKVPNRRKRRLYHRLSSAVIRIRAKFPPSSKGSGGSNWQDSGLCLFSSFPPCFPPCLSQPTPDFWGDGLGLPLLPREQQVASRQKTPISLVRVGTVPQYFLLFESLPVSVRPD